MVKLPPILRVDVVLPPIRRPSVDLRQCVLVLGVGRYDVGIVSKSPHPVSISPVVPELVGVDISQC